MFFDLATIFSGRMDERREEVLGASSTSEQNDGKFQHASAYGETATLHSWIVDRNTWGFEVAHVACLSRGVTR